MKKILFAFLLWFVTQNLIAQNTLKFKSLTTKNGLSHSDVMCVYLDHEGYVWMGTAEGVSRYNGISVVSYKNEKNNPSSLSGNYVYTIYEDKNDRLWFGTSGEKAGGLCYFDRRKDHFIQVNLDSIGIKGSIHKMMEDSNNKLWIASSVGLYEFDRKKMKAEPHINECSGVSCTGISELNKNQLIVSFSDPKRGGLFVYNYQKNTFSRYSTESNPSLTDNEINTFDIDSQKNIWIAGRNNGINVLNIKLNKVQIYQNKPQDPNSLTNNRIGRIVIADNGFVFASISEMGVDVLNPYSQKFIHCRKTDDDRSLVSNSVTDIYKSSGGTIWISSWSGGVNIYDERFDKFACYRHEVGRNSITKGSLTSFAEDSKGNIWIGNDGEGFSCFNPNTESFTNYKNSEGGSTLLSNNKVLMVSCPNEGELWTGMWMGGIDQFAINGDKISKKKNILDFDKKETFSNCVLRVIKESDDRYLIGTFASLYLYEKKKNCYTKINPIGIDGKPKAFCSINDIIKDSENNYWCAAAGAGIMKVNSQTLRVESFFHDDKNPKSLADNMVFFIHEDRKKNLWIGTSDGFLDLLNPKTKVFTHFNKANGLPDARMCGMLEDARGNLWLSTSKGISKVTPVLSGGKMTLKVRNFNELDGLQGKVFNAWAFLKSKDGKMYFGGQNGFNSFYPDSIKDNPEKPPVYFTDFLLFNKPVSIDGKDSPLNAHISQLKEISLRYDQSLFTLHYIALNYIYGEKNQYAYKMEGFDKDWNYVGSKTDATYTNLDPGEYVFHVIASNNDGVWNENGAKIKIIILPPWWKTWWFRIFAFIFVAGATIGYYRMRIRNLERQKTILEEKVKIRTSELNEANVELMERQEEILQQQDEILSQRDEIMLQKDVLESTNLMLTQKSDAMVRAFTNSQLLSQFGQKVTSELDMGRIDQMVYQYISSLMPADSFGIGIYHEKMESIVFRNLFSNHTILPPFSIPLDGADSIITNCFKKHEITLINCLNETDKEYIKSIFNSDHSKIPQSSVIVPLYSDKRGIGILLVYSGEVNSYSEHDVTNLQTLASYIAIASDNASAYKTIRVKNESINSSIRYGLTIQQAILPRISDLETYFETMIIYKPKDVVSGDFYWYADMADAGFFVAVVDCTGHGVPGAFMSMIGNRLLNEIVIEERNYEPNLILEALDQKVRLALKQVETDNKDGMDVCLCRFTPKEDRKLSIEFCGAKRSLYIYRKGAQTLDSFPADRKSVGGIRTRSHINFTNQKIEIEQEDTLFLLSDGIIDQNDENRKRFGTERFSELILKTANLPMNELRETFLHEISLFQKNEDQRDDITILGLRLKKHAGNEGAL